jgi:hypothetical protein
MQRLYQDKDRGKQTSTQYELASFTRNQPAHRCTFDPLELPGHKTVWHYANQPTQHRRAGHHPIKKRYHAGNEESRRQLGIHHSVNRRCRVTGCQHFVFRPGIPPLRRRRHDPRPNTPLLSGAEYSDFAMALQPNMRVMPANTKVVGDIDFSGVGGEAGRLASADGDITQNG